MKIKSVDYYIQLNERDMFDMINPSPDDDPHSQLCFNEDQTSNNPWDEGGENDINEIIESL